MRQNREGLIVNVELIKICCTGWSGPVTRVSDLDEHLCTASLIKHVVADIELTQNAMNSHAVHHVVKHLCMLLQGLVVIMLTCLYSHKVHVCMD